MVNMELLPVDVADPIQVVLDRFGEVATYRATLKSVSKGKTDIIRYYFKKPGFVRMETVAPFKGAVLVYDPFTRLVKLWPFGYGSFPALSLSPGNNLIRSSTGQRVDRSDAGTLYRNVKSLQERGVTEVLGMDHLEGKRTLHVQISGAEGYSHNGIVRYRLWLDRETGFPLKVMSYARGGGLIEDVRLQGLEINFRFPDDFFRQE